MQAPINPDDDKIKELLVSNDSALQDAGLKLIDRTYRFEIPGYIRRWNENGIMTLDSHDLAVVWQATLISVDRNVKNGMFKLEGNLGAYLRTIAHCRAVDLIRRTLRIRPTDDLDDIPVWSQNQRGEIMEVINKLVGNLRENLRIVIKIDIELFFEKFEWPSIEKLTGEVNRLFPDTPLTKSAVKGRRSRGRAKLRELFGSDTFLDGWI